MKTVHKLLCSTIACFLFTFSAFGQQNLTTPIQNFVSYDVGVYSALAYQWQTNVFTGSATSGTFSITLYQAAFTTPDGRRYAPFANATLPPITIGSGANLETVTPSSSSNCATVNTIAANQGVCTLTATFSNPHGRGDFIISGDYGIQEAINDASNNGGGQVFWYIPSGPANYTGIIPQPVTLATGSANTTMASTNIPTRTSVFGSARVTTTIGTCAGGWSLGFTTGTEITAANTTLTAGTTTDSSTFSAALLNAAATAPIVHCTTSNASAGAVRAAYWGYKYAPSAF